MTCRAVVCGWKQAILPDPTEELLGRGIARAIVTGARRDAFRGDLSRFKVHLRFLRAMTRLRPTWWKCRDGRESMRVFFEIYDQYITRGESAAVVGEAVAQYAAAAARRLDGRLLAAVRSARGEGKAAALLSVSFEQGIRAVLAAAGQADLFSPVAANRFVEADGKMTGMELDVYERKPEVLRARVLAPLGLTEADILYIGGSAGDEPVAALLPRGRFAVSFLAPEARRARLAEQYGAFVPADEADLRAWLKS